MRIKLGVHTGPQDLQMDELKRVWTRADEAGFHWISVWDHCYANPLNQRTDPCFEAVASMPAVAALTANVRIGCLVFCTLFHQPSLLAKAAGRKRLEHFPEHLRLGALTGTPSAVIDCIGAYIESGADGLNIAFRPPVDWDAYEAYIEQVLPVFHTP